MTATLGVALGTLASLGAAGTAAAAGAASRVPSTATTGSWGVYAGPGPKNVAGAPAFARATGLPISGVVDFTPTNSWAGITSSRWLITPYTGQPLALELSVPMLPDDRRPDGAPWSLAECATGAYDANWATLGRSLVAEGLPATVVRPGWEFNGAWFRWGAGGKVDAFRGCFQHLVRAMRAVPGSRFTFDWNPNIGLGTFPAEQAYPGDAYVDVVGVDIYDVSWTWYPVPVGTTTAQAREAAWNWLLRGDHGLTFWSAFARAHAKPLTIPEWGVTARPDGHGGGDDPAFVDHMVDFITDPANNVRGNHYFNIDTPALQHDLTRSGTKFPASGVRLRTRASIMAGTSAVTAPAVPTVTPSPSPTTRVGSVPLTASPTASPAASPTSPPAVTGRPVPAKASASARHRTASQRPHKKHKMHRRHRPSAATNTHLSQSR